MSGNSFHEIKATFQTNTIAAICVNIDDKSYWFHLSTINLNEPLIDFERGDSIVLEVQEWILVENDLDCLIEA